jgi:DNA-directed RNA polymerase I, II, and III subunit RPABC1
MMEVEQLQASTTAPIDRGAAALTADASRLFRVYKTVSALLSKRGYMVSREMREMTPASFTAKFGEYPSREGLTILVVSEVP